MLVTPEQINGWRSRQGDRSIYTLANVHNYVREHPGSNSFEIYVGINGGHIPTDLDARRSGMTNTMCLLSVLKKRGKIRSEKPACGYKTRGHYSMYWVIE